DVELFDAPAEEPVEERVPPVAGLAPAFGPGLGAGAGVCAVASTAKETIKMLETNTLEANKSFLRMMVLLGLILFRPATFNRCLSLPFRKRSSKSAGRQAETFRMFL